MTQEQIERYQRDAKIAYHTKAYEGSFEKYWDLTSVLRTDASVPWDDVKAIKQAAWDGEEQ